LKKTLSHEISLEHFGDVGMNGDLFFDRKGGANERCI
jgi:hypothetical protein